MTEEEQSPFAAAVEAGRKAEGKRLKKVGNRFAEGVTVAGEGLLGVSAILEAGSEFPIQRAVGEGFRNIFAQGALHPNFQELPNTVGHFFSTLHPEQAIPFAALVVATGAAEGLRRVIRRRR
ncbi:MAG TPA: hypothetical protein VF189_01265 [Patescibacteria group bacterium]